MWSRVVYGGLYVPSNYSKFICDTAADLSELPTNKKPSTKNGFKSCSVGSLAIVIEDSSTYILSNSGEWTKFKTDSSVLDIDGTMLIDGERILVAK